MGEMSQRKVVESQASQIIDVVGGISQDEGGDNSHTDQVVMEISAGRSSHVMMDVSSDSSQGNDLDDSVLVIPASPPSKRDVSIINISDDSKNKSLQLELSESATPDSTQRRNGGGSVAPQRESFQPAQLSAILAPNSLLYDDLDNIIDNNEDVQDGASRQQQCV
jgi:hypothetical protein